MRQQVAPGTTAGNKIVPLLVTDGQGRRAVGTIQLTVAVVAPHPAHRAPQLGPVRASRHCSRHLVTPGANPTSTGLRVALNLTPLGGSAATELSNAGGALCDQAAGDSTFTACLQLSPAVPAIPSLEATALSATVASDIPIVAERAMWWPGSGEAWREAHVSAGATTPGRMPDVGAYSGLGRGRLVCKEAIYGCLRQLRRWWFSQAANGGRQTVSKDTRPAEREELADIESTLAGVGGSKRPRRSWANGSLRRPC